MILVAAWTLITIGIGIWAHRWGRNGLGWAIGSLIVSPLIAAIILLIAGTNVEKRFEIVTNEDGTQTATEYTVSKGGRFDMDELKGIGGLLFWLFVAYVIFWGFPQINAYLAQRGMALY